MQQLNFIMKDAAQKGKQTAGLLRAMKELQIQEMSLQIHQQQIPSDFTPDME
jgi:hypothetical protein